MKQLIKNTLVLTPITLVSGLLLGLVYEVTKAPIARSKENAKQKAYEKVLSEADEFQVYDEFDADAYDALCELINVMNGAYATRLCNEDIDVTLHPPVFYRNTEVTADNGLYVVTFAMGDNLFKILMAADDKIRLSA